jgi:hypothetical protein
MIRLALTFGWLVLMIASADAAPQMSVAGGYDYAGGVDGQQTHGALLGLGLGAEWGDASLAGVRFDDNRIGPGFGASASIGWEIGTMITLRASGTRLLADESYRAWRWKAGPQVTLTDQRQISFSYVRYEDALGASNGVVGEAAVPLRALLTGKATASYAENPDGQDSVHGSIGVAWRLVSNLELSGEIGVAKNGVVTSQTSFPSQRPLGGLPILGGGDPGPESQHAEDRVSTISLLGVRVLFP